MYANDWDIYLQLQWIFLPTSRLWHEQITHQQHKNPYQENLIILRPDLKIEMIIPLGA